MKIWDWIKSKFPAKAQEAQTEKPKYPFKEGVWLHFELDGPISRLERCMDPESAPAQKPAILVYDRTLDDLSDFTGKCFDWHTFPKPWRDELELHGRFLSMTFDELKEYVI